MQFLRWLTETETAPLTLGQVAQVNTGLEDADFWLQRKGDEKTVGKVYRKLPQENRDYFIKENIGVKIKEEWRERLDPLYLSYVMEAHYTEGLWRRVASGTLKLVNIKTSQVKKIPV